MSLHEFTHDTRKILHLFPSRDHHLAMEAVIEGKCDGTIFVDRKENPKTAAVWCAPGNEAQLYLAGASDNTSFNTGVHDFFVDTIRPESIHIGLNAFQAYCRSPWEKPLLIIFKDETLFKDKDSYLICKAQYAGYKPSNGYSHVWEILCTPALFEDLQEAQKTVSTT